MAQYYPVVVQAGRNLAGDSLGFHAYSLRVDNCTNQWYLEETSLAYIPPYSLGLCLRLYGTGVAILLASAPIGQAQLAPITGEQVVGVYSDQLRTEVAASPIRQFTLVQSVSDLTQGAMPATPPVGVTRMWAANDGTLHYLLPTGVDATLLSSTNYASYVATAPVGGDLLGTINNAVINVRASSAINAFDNTGTAHTWWASFGGTDNAFVQFNARPFRWVNQNNTLGLMNLDTSGTLTIANALTVGQNAIISGGILYFVTGSNYLQWDGTHIATPNPFVSTSYIIAGTSLSANGGNLYFRSDNAIYITWNGSLLFTGSPWQFNSSLNVLGMTSLNGAFVLQQGIAPAQAGGGIIYWHNNQTIYQYLNFPYVTMYAAGISLAATTASAYAVITQNVGGTAGAMMATAYNLWSSVEHAREYGIKNVQIQEPMALVKSVTGYYYDHISFDDDSKPMRRDDGSLETTPMYGFSALEVSQNIPEVATDRGVDNSRMVAILWEAVKACDARISALEAA